MGYSPPKCTCNGSTQTHSRKYMILLEYLHDMDENVTHPFPLLVPSLTPSRMPKPNVRKHCFQNKRFLFSKTYYQVSVKSIGQPSETNLLDNSLKQFMGSSDVNCWTISQPNSSKNLPLKFLSQPFYFLFSFMSCTHTYHSRVPRCIWNALCYFQTIHVNIEIMHTLTEFIQFQWLTHNYISYNSSIMLTH